jgi:preprotein translocase subunit SecA
MSTTTHWYAPQDASLTPWYSLEGWLSLIRHQSGYGYKSLWRSAVDLHQKLHISPLENTAPTSDELSNARSDIYKLEIGGNAGDQKLTNLAAKIAAIEVVSKVACHELGQRPSLPQILAALAMTEGYLIQLAPGEGKTLAIGIAAVIFAWGGKPLHIVTSNDYLASRDARLLSSFYGACGVSVASITSDTPSHEVALCYRKHVVYATANQLLADFLRDDILVNGSRDPLSRRLWRFENQTLNRQPVMRGLHAAIIDEADGVLIDEATTPLIIASPEEDKTDMLQAIRLARDLVGELKVGLHYTLYAKGTDAVHFSDLGKQIIERLATAFNSYWQSQTRREEIFRLAVMAREVYQRDRHYIILDATVVIVDDSTGRAMPGRSWSHGVHQSIEARVGVEMTPLTKISARMTFQEFFRHYHRLCGASGTLQGLDLELWQTFGLFILRVPPKAPSRLDIMPQRIFRTRAEKLTGLISQVQALNRKGLPVLVGTRRILDSEEIANILRDQGFSCEVINAKEHETEAQVVSRAGQKAAITVATNMAGRGTDIGISRHIAAIGGLQVLMFEVHESPRIDWQLFGRAGRQGARGSAQAFISLEEELITRFSPAWVKPFSKLIPNTLTESKLKILQWFSQRHASQIAKRQRRHLAYIQRELREQLGFSKG